MNKSIKIALSIATCFIAVIVLGAVVHYSSGKSIEYRCYILEQQEKEFDFFEWTDREKEICQIN